MPTKLEILEFMALYGVTRIMDLVEYFGYSTSGARRVLTWLKRQYLVTNDRRGEWVITDRGYERLDYLRDKMEEE